MKKVIFCISGSQDILPSLIKEYEDKEILLIQLDLWLKDFSAREGILLKGYADYMSYEDCMDIEKDALVFAKNWYMAAEEDISEYRGYSLGEIIKMPMLDFFIKVLKNILIIQRVIDRESADEITIFDDKSVLSRIFLNFALDTGVKFRKIDMPAKAYAPEGFEILRVPKVPAHFFGFVMSILQNTIWVLINAGLSIASSMRKKTANTMPKLNIYFDPYKGYLSLAERLFKNFDYEVFLPQPPLRDFRHIIFLWNVFRNKVTFYSPKHNRKTLSSSVLKEARDFPFSFWQRFINTASPEERFTWRGVNFWDAISIELRNRYVAFFSELILEISYAEYVIERYKLNVFLMPWDDSSFNKSFTSVAKKSNLLTMRYQHGVFGKHPHLPVPRSDKMVVWGESAKNYYLERNISPDRIIITGNPMVDVLARRKRDTNRLKICKKIRLTPTKKIVLYADTASASDITALDNFYDPSRVLLKFINAANKLPDTQFLVKFHHGDAEMKEKIELIKNHNRASNIRMFDTGFDVYTLIVNSDLVITEFSTVGFEAMLLDKPVIIFNLRNGGMDYVSPYEDGKGVVVVNREEDIVPTIQRLFTDHELLKKLESGRKEFLEYENRIWPGK